MTARATTLREVSERSESLEDFGLNLRDWLHEIRRASSRPEAERSISEEPFRLSGKFSKGEIADSWLAAYAEHLAGRIGSPPPAWAFEPWRISKQPLFGEGDSQAQRTTALIHSALAFKRRNIFTGSVDLPLRLRAGRPVKSAAEKRKVNAERQRRFRKARQAELEALRTLAATREKLRASERSLA